jgi:malate permease and related proteins
MIERLLGIVVPVAAVIALGWLWGYRAKPDMSVVNRLSMNVLAPALIFSALSSKSFDVADHGFLMLGCIGVVLGSGLLAWPIARMLREDPRAFVPPMMFNNCGNMGLPLAVLAYGEAGFAPMVALFTISNLLHFTLGVWIVDRRARFVSLAQNPMVWSTVAGFAFAIFHPPLPAVAAVTIRLVGEALIPMMLLSLGVRLTGIRWSEARLGVIGGIVCPLTGLAMAALLVPFLALDARQAGLLYLFGCLPPAVLNFMVAEQYHREPAKVASIVLVGNVLSIVFVPIGLAIALR